MTDDLTDQAPAHSAFLVLTAIADLGEVTAAAIAQHAGLGYSTVTPKLRAWENSGHAEKYRHAATSQTLWRLTAAGQAATATPAEHAGPSAAQPPTIGLRADTDQSDTGPDTGLASGSPAESAAAPPQVEVKPWPAALTEAQPDPLHAGEQNQQLEGPRTEVVAVEAVPGEAATPDADKDVAASGADGAETNSDAKPAQRLAPAAQRKRPAGALAISVLAILQSRPDERFRVNDLRKLVDAADEGSGYPAASAGAVFNALIKLAGEGRVLSGTEKPATFQAAPVTN